MGQVTIYLDEEVEAKARAAAQAAGQSLSKWIATRIARGGSEQWPESVRSLAGAWSDLPTAEALRRPKTKDVARQKL